ncbi:MAG: methyltransferase domain-containing protein [Actinobacteria bacterium]|nr:methyltransferase domain-containing protein [Actinomycetota bacterium]
MGQPPKPAKEVLGSWDDRENARRYAEFARTFSMYQDTSRDLVAAAGIKPGETVADLCCGSGVTTDTILEAVGPDGRVIGIDASAAMLAEAAGHLTDPRVEFVHSPAEELASVTPAPIGSVICNSAMWQTDVRKVATEISTVLGSGGRVVFNIPRRFLIMPFTAEELGPRTPGLTDIAIAIAILDYGFVPNFRGNDGPRRAPLTPEAVTEALRDAGLSPEEPEVVEYELTLEERRAWLSIPVFCTQTPGRTYDEKMEILDAAYERMGDPEPERSRWLIFKATKP